MTVMIKSWTGEMVPVRVRMDVSHPIIDMSLLKITMISDTPFGIWVSAIDDTSMEYDVKLDDLTMISCPFAVGDEVIEPVHLSNGDISYRTRILDKYDIDYINGAIYLGEYRHANPNLRTKPEGDV